MSKDDLSRVDGQRPAQPGIFRGSAYATPMDMITNPAPVAPPAGAPQVVQEQAAYPTSMDMSQPAPTVPAPTPAPAQENS